MLVTAGVIVFDKSGKKLRSFTNEQLSAPTGIAVDGSNIYVADYSNNTLLKFDKTGNLFKSVGQKGSGKGEFNGPAGVTVVGDEVIVCDFRNHRLQVFTSDLVFVRQFGSQGRGIGQFIGPFDVTHDEDGNLYITDSMNNRVQIFNTQGEFLRFLEAPGHITRPFGISFCHGVVYISQKEENGNVYVYHKNGDKICSIPCASGEGGFYGIAIDQDGFVYVCDNSNLQVVVL